MPRIIVQAEDPAQEVVLWERVGADDFDAEHFRRCLCDRIAWAVQDAEQVQSARVLPESVDEDRERYARDRSPDPVYA